MSEQNKAIARWVFEELQSKGNVVLIDERVVADYVGHEPFGDIQGPEGAKRFNSMLRAAFPDLQIVIEDQIAEGDKVVTRWTAHGTHQGLFQGVPPTGRQAATTGMTIFRIADGRLIEGWVTADLLGLLRQLGAIAEPERNGL